jgi:hypothetical protein
MRRGIYIVANDRVVDNAIALVSSIRIHDPDLSIILIPFNHDFQQVATILNTCYQVEIFPDLLFLETLTQTIAEIFPRDFLNLPNKMRKLATWFGPLDEFLYVDTDIIVFQPLTETLNYLKQADFLCCDFHYKGRGLKDVFSPNVLAHKIFNKTDLQDVFNSGFWGSKKGAILLDKMYEVLAEAAQHKEYFDFSSGTTDQPILNYLILRSIPHRLNIVKAHSHEPGSWGGSPHFVDRDHILYDHDAPLRYLHWAGIRIQPGCPYWDTWKHYRSLKDPDYVEPVLTSRSQDNWKQSIKDILKRFTPSPR